MPGKLDRRYALFALGLILLTCVPVFAGFVGAWWELSQWAGLAACVLCVGLCGAPVRPRDSSPPVLLSLRAHALLGWAAAGLIALHVGGLVLSDHRVIEYLKPSLPPYMAAGLVASLVALMLVSTSAARVRRRLWHSHRGFQATHVILGVVCVAVIALHVVPTGRYAGGWGRRSVVLATTLGAVMMLLRQRRSRSAAGVGGDRGSRWVFGRHSVWVAATVCLAAVTLLGLVRGAGGTALHEPLLPRAQTLPLDFPHAMHVQVNCLTCHHNYADGRGFENCILCHKSGRTDLKVGVEARFHGFCFECHRHPGAALARQGPVSGCTSCHRAAEGKP